MNFSKEFLKEFLQKANKTHYSHFEIQNEVIVCKEGNTGLDRIYKSELIFKILNDIFNKLESYSKDNKWKKNDI